MSKKDFQFYHQFRVRYSEVDGQKVVFNAHYLTYFDTAITEYFRWLPFDYVNHFDQTGHDFHTARTAIDYKAPIRFDEDIEVFVKTARVGRSSLSFALSIHGQNEDHPRATGEVVWVYINLETGKSAPVYPDLLALLQKREEGTP